MHVLDNLCIYLIPYLPDGAQGGDEARLDLAELAHLGRPGVPQQHAKYLRQRPPQAAVVSNPHSRAPGARVSQGQAHARGEGARHWGGGRGD